MKKVSVSVLALVSLLCSCGGAATKWDAAKAFGDKELDYCLLIGQIDHNDSAARTAGIRSALHTRGTATTNANTEKPVDGKLTLNGTEYAVKEIENQEAKNTSGATWDAQTATSLAQGWFNTHGDKIDFIVSNNDGMAEGAVAASNYIEGTPIFGYDSNSTTLTAIKEGRVRGTVNQNAPAQVAGILRLARNVIDKVADPIASGFTTAGDYGKISSTFNYKEDSHAYLVDNFAITKENVDQYAGKSAADLVDKGVTKKAGVTTKANVFLNYYNSSDTFLNATVKPLVNAYADTFNRDINDSNAGDGNSDSSVLDKITSKYDAYILNTVKTTAASSYLDKVATVEGATAANPCQKPVIFYNRQATKADNTVDTEVRKDSRFTHIYYVGFDAIQGGEVQGKRIVDYLTAQEKASK